MLRWPHPAINQRLIFWLGLALVILGRLFYYYHTAPSILNQDEAAILLNARLLSETGRDEWGMAWPLTFRSFGDFKLPGYIYLVAGLGKVIGFTNLTVRLPSLAAGIILLWLVWRMVAVLTRSRSVGLVAALLLAISPWSWHYGTLGFEAHLGLTLWLAALGLFLFNRRPSVLFAGSALLLGSILTYNAPLLLLPTILLGVVLVDWGHWRIVGSKLLLLIATGLIGASLVLPATLQKGGIAIFQDPTLLNAYPLYRSNWSGIGQTLLGNRYVYFGGIAVRHWGQHFSWQFLVMRGGNNPWHTIPLTGHVSFLLPLLVAVGLGTTGRRLCLAIRRQRWGGVRQELLWLTLLGSSLVPAAITTDTPHATRSLFFLVVLAVFGARALVDMQNRYCRPAVPSWLSHTLTFTLAAGLVLSFAWWWVPAGGHWRTAPPQRWNTGLDVALRDSRVTSAPQVSIVDPNGVLYTLVATSLKIPADVFYQTVKRSPPDTAGLVRVEKLDHYQFIFQASDAQSPGLLLQPHSNAQWDIIEL